MEQRKNKTRISTDQMKRKRIPAIPASIAEKTNDFLASIT